MLKCFLKLIKYLVIVLPLKNEFKYTLRNKIKKYYIEKKYNDCLIFSSLTSMGDMIFLSSLISKLKKQYKRKVVILGNKNYPDIIYLLNKDIDFLYKIDNDFFLYLLTYTTYNNIEDLKPGKIYQIGSKFTVRYKTNNYIDNFVNNHFPFLIEKSIDTINLSISNNLYSYNSNKILITPYSVTFNGNLIPLDFWYNLINRLNKLGYNIIVNTNNDDSNFINYNKIFLPIDKQLEFAQSCSCIIGTRSGILDVFSLYNISNIITIFPPNLEENFIKDNQIYYDIIKDINENNYLEKKFDFYSISKTLNNPNYLDIIYKDNSTIDLIINKISSFNN